MVLDLFSPRVVGWTTIDRLKRDLAVAALRRALAARNPAPGLVHHSDRGSQYCSVDYQALLRRRGILISMSGRGNCYDNSMVETCFKTIESELIWLVAWKTRAQADDAVARYIDGFYNPVRRHSSLAFQGPIAFERKPREVSQTLSRKSRASPPRVKRSDMSKRSTHDAGIKARVALEAVKGERTVSELAAEYGFHPTMIHQCKRTLLQGAAGIFEPGGKAEMAAEVAEETVRDLHAKIGELAVANDFLSRRLMPWIVK
jgi:putative transposase